MHGGSTVRALDLFCGGGGVAQGLFEAGFSEVVGVDNDKRCKRVYPGEFCLVDITKPLPFDVSDFDFVWASPPGQMFSRVCLKEHRDKSVNLIPRARELLKDHPFTCIENVPGAPIRTDLILTGPTLGLTRVLRKRIFELSFFCLTPPIRTFPKGYFENGHAITVLKSTTTRQRHIRKALGLRPQVAKQEALDAMGITVPMTRNQVGEAIPPAYSRFIGQAAIDQIKRSNGV